MNIKISIAGLVAGALLLPVAGYTADATKSTVTEKVKENAGAEAHKAVAIANDVKGMTAFTNELRLTSSSTSKGSDAPVDDTLITTRVKARMATDKLVSATSISVKTVNGVVELSGTAHSRAEADKAVAIARAIPEVKSVKNDIHVASTSSGSSMSKSGDSTSKGSDAPVDDTLITTRVKARMATDKLVSATSISVKTVNGVVELSGTANSRAEADKAVAIARAIPEVKSVKNDIHVASTSSGSSMSKSGGSTSKGSDAPVDDTLITTRVKARMATDKLVSATSISVKTVNGVVELSGTAHSRAEADKAVAIARAIPEVKSVKNDIHVASTSSGSSMSKSGDSTSKGSDAPVDDTLITTRVKARMATDKLVSATSISVKTVNGVVELSGTANSRAEADKAVAIARAIPEVKSVKNDIHVK